MKILFVGAEMMPFAATGGLGDVMGSLPQAIAEAGREEVDVRTVIPLYSSIGQEWRDKMHLETKFYVRLAWREQYCGIYSLKKDGVTCYFIDNAYYFLRQGTLYSHYDDGERYAYFCMAVMYLMEKLDFFPDVLQCNDWQSALSIVYLKTLFAGRNGYRDIRTLYTIHNIEYQGKYDFAILGDVFALGNEWHNLLAYDGCINLCKAAVVCADRISTVSPRYAKEICEPEHSHGLYHIIRENQYKLCGILNGIDYSYYNPETDSVLFRQYSAYSLENKYQNKIILQKDLGLPENADIPMLIIISRLAAHKGLDIVSQVMDGLLQNFSVQFVVLGRGEAPYEMYFRKLECDYPYQARAMITYDRDLSKKIYAAGDIFMMPSRSEPCGLAQMIASRYGAIPVVRETGGLADSIVHFREENGELTGNGVTFEEYSGEQLYRAVGRAIAYWNDTEKRPLYLQKIMSTDFSWGISAQRYLALFRSMR